MRLLQIAHIKRVRLSPTGDSLTQQHFTFHDGEKKDYSSQSSCINSIDYTILLLEFHIERSINYLLYGITKFIFEDQT